MSIVTKSGSNDWHYGSSVEWAPDWGAAKGKNVRERDPDAADPLYQYRSDNQFDSTIYSAYASGPIVKDRLFFFAMVEGRNETVDIFRSVNSERRRDTTPQGLVKLDWYINDSNLVEFTGIYNQAKTKYSTYEYNLDANGETVTTWAGMRLRSNSTRWKTAARSASSNTPAISLTTSPCRRNTAI